ncbi:isoprenoid synthase domain-containing protein [Butyriboletus roseoflavus]|nr:isoprenoid synthase domain-containing protein [Butyriboletus roseoflavus]
MLDTQLIQSARENICSLLEQCNVVYEVTPFDEVLYQESIDDAIRRGSPVDGDPSLRTCLRVGVSYVATAGVYLRHRPTQIWIALYTSCICLLDDTAKRFPAEMPNIYQFNNRFIRREPQGSAVLDAFADLIRRASDFYPPIACHLLTTLTMNVVTATLLEHETSSMKISSAAHQYPIYQRILSGVSEAYAFTVFPREVPLNDYIQAIPEMTLFINNVNDILSFYKEERVGETTNQISTLAARTKKSKLETYGELTETTIGLYKRIVKILEESPEVCEAFEHFKAGFVYFHTSTARYRLEDLDL